jgi:hypothetical protein
MTILESHRHDLPCCNGADHHSTCDGMGPEVSRNCEPEHGDQPTIRSICRHQLRNDGRLAMAISCGSLKEALSFISKWASQNNYDLTLIFEQINKVPSEDPANDAYWDYDITGEE